MRLSVAIMPFLNDVSQKSYSEVLLIAFET